MPNYPSSIEIKLDKAKPLYHRVLRTRYLFLYLFSLVLVFSLLKHPINALSCILVLLGLLSYVFCVALVDQLLEASYFKKDENSKIIFTSETLTILFKNKKLSWDIQECKKLKIKGTNITLTFPAKPKRGLKRIGWLTLKLRPNHELSELAHEYTFITRGGSRAHINSDSRSAQSVTEAEASTIMRFLAAYFDIPKVIDCDKSNSFERIQSR